MTEPIDIPVRYLSTDRSLPCILRIADAGVALFAKNQQSMFTWDQVRRVSFDDPGRTKANVGAIAVFGVLGLASRRAYTLITISTTGPEMYFENDAPIGQWRASAFRITEAIPAASGRIWVDGTQVASTSPSPTVAGQVVVSPGWYPDPLGQPRLRWHDGTAWTDHTSAGPPPPV